MTWELEWALEHWDELEIRRVAPLSVWDRNWLEVMGIRW